MDAHHIFAGIQYYLGFQGGLAVKNSDYTTKSQSSRQYGIGTKTDI